MRKKRLHCHDQSAHDEPQINLTPLIDVVFIVLILFIIIAPMLELDRVQLASASAKENRQVSTVQQEQSLSIYVREDNSIWLNQKMVDISTLTSFLKQSHRQFPHKIPQLFHDKKAHFGTYQAVKNAVELSGYEQMDVILQPGG